jgi:hypothetical protein
MLLVSYQVDDHSGEWCFKDYQPGATVDQSVIDDIKFAIAAEYESSPENVTIKSITEQ